MHVCVIGAGVVGAATAWQLAQGGVRVTLLEAGPGPGLACSYANGAQLSYEYVAPWANPGAWLELPGMLWQRASPFRLDGSVLLRDWRWFVRFLWACRPAASRRAARTLWRLAALSRETLETWMQHAGPWPGFRRSGKLVLCPDERALARMARVVRAQADWGGDQHMLDRAGCVEVEPALAHCGASFHGGVWTPGECVVDAHELAGTLVGLAVRHGATARFDARVTSIVSRKHRVQAVCTKDLELEVDAVVVAAGIGSARLCRPLGVRLSVAPVKGYSVTLALRDPGRVPTVSVTDLKQKAVYARVGERLRVAAMAEWVGNDATVDLRRIDQMLRMTDALFPGAVDVTRDVRPWAGLRPMTPNSVPLVGSTSVRGLFLNTGHGALGLTLAAGSAVSVSRLVQDGAARRGPSRAPALGCVRHLEAAPSASQEGNASASFVAHPAHDTPPHPRRLSS